VKICLSCEGVTDTQAQRCGHCGALLLPTDAVHYPARRGEADAGNPMLGTVIDGKYRLLSVLGRGGLGTVFRAQHVGSLLTVALKLLHPRFAHRREYRRALLPEARRAATVVHEHCARLLDVGEVDEGVSYLAMELVKGDLRGIARAVRLSRRTMSNIRQNLVFAFGYNALGVPLAAGVLYPAFGLLLSPIIASLAMSLSSVSVVGNALRLRSARL
jgi:hypothetical protein